MKKTILVTGGAGFIGSAVIRHILDNSNFKVINIDKLTYASNDKEIKKFIKYDNYQFKNIEMFIEPRYWFNLTNSILKSEIDHKYHVLGLNIGVSLKI